MSETISVDQRPAPGSASSGRAGATIRLIVLHSDPRPRDAALAAYAEAAAEGAPHYSLDSQGSILQLVPEDRAAQHSGLALWQGRWRNIDRISVGITVEHTPGAPYPRAALPALTWLVSEISLRYGLSPEALQRWESRLPDQERGQGVLTPAALPAVAIEIPFERLGPEDEALPEPDPALDVQCVPPPLPELEVLGPVEDDPQQARRLWEALQAEAYRQRGGGYNSGWAFHQRAVQENLGAPLAPSTTADEQLGIGGKRYGYQPFARDTLFNQVPLWSQVQSLAQSLGGAIPASGLARAVLEASYQRSGAALHANWAFHQLAVREKLGPPLGQSYSIEVGGQRLSLQIFACDTLYTLISPPPAPTNWSDVRRLSATEPGAPLFAALWAETYKPCGGQYRPESPFQQLAAREKLGTPLSDVYDLTVDGQGYSVQVFTLDILYRRPGEAVLRQSGLPKPSFASQPGQNDNQQALGAERPTFHLLPLPGRPQISQFYGYTKWSAGRGRQFYGQTQGRHSGIDFSVVVGTPILAVAPGLVVAAGKSGEVPFGGCPPMVVVVRHGSAYAIYGHMSEVHVRRGQLVRSGQVLGKSGSYGGPHLHFELRPVPQALLTNSDPNQRAQNPGTALNPVDFFSAEWKPYFEDQLRRLGGVRHFCVGSFHDQGVLTFGAPVDSRPCAN